MCLATSIPRRLMIVPEEAQVEREISTMMPKLATLDRDLPHEMTVDTTATLTTASTGKNNSGKLTKSTRQTARKRDNRTTDRKISTRPQP